MPAACEHHRCSDRAPAAEIRHDVPIEEICVRRFHLLPLSGVIARSLRRWELRQTETKVFSAMALFPPKALEAYGCGTNGRARWQKRSLFSRPSLRTARQRWWQTSRLKECCRRFTRSCDRLAGWLSPARNERDHTLQPTALVHEAYLRLARAELAWTGRTARICSAIAATHDAPHSPDARRSARRCRSAGAAPRGLSLDVSARCLRAARGHRRRRCIRCCANWTALDPRQGQIVELRFFGGLER